ncbi:MAG TPA: methyl-accepting chemotaxis protein, partial [Gemmatimonadaceae bacterium]|nr:methyl-accepting chemotaxis protein [Gemmatimonadaceae bacterium]
RAGTRRADELGLPQMSIGAIEAQFAAARTMDADVRYRAYLAEISPRTGIAEAILTDRYGHNAVTTSRTQDFMQADEEWWEIADRAGATAPTASYDDWAKVVAMTMSAAVRDPVSGRGLGVLKLTYLFDRTDSALSAGGESGIHAELVDRDGNVVASSSPSTPRMKPFLGIGAASRANDTVVVADLRDGREWLSVSAVGTNGWRIIAHIPERVALDQSAAATRTLGLGVAGIVVALLFALGFVDRFVMHRITGPAGRLRVVAEAVAAGNLSVDVTSVGAHADDEIGRLARATGTMIDELRRLASALRASASETSAMAAEITSGASSMAATAEAMADTSSDLSEQSGTMSQAISQFASDSTRLVAISSELDAGSQEGLERNVKLRELASENRVRLDQSIAALEVLSADVAASAAASDALAGASEEIRAFVTFVQKMARQSKLLALNAAMEAARAGIHGQGFAVVASEVRRLAAGAAESAERTENLVREVLARVNLSRDSTARTVGAVQSVLGATKQGLESFVTIQSAVVENEEWMRAISQASAETHALIGEMTRRLDSVSRTTESFAASMQEVAASSEEQSASTAEIADVARALAASAEQLARIVSRFQLGEAPVRRLTPPAEASAPVAAPRDGTPGVPSIVLPPGPLATVE